jgi:hypothetical protein
MEVSLATSSGTIASSIARRHAAMFPCLHHRESMLGYKALADRGIGFRNDQFYRIAVLLCSPFQAAGAENLRRFFLAFPYGVPPPRKAGGTIIETTV